MLSKLLALWRALSILFLILSGWIAWKGVQILKEADAASRPVSASAALSSQGEPVCLRDSLIFDLRQAGLGQKNVMGIKGKEYAVIPAHTPQDTSHTILVISSDPAWIGPVVNEYLSHMSSSLNASNYDVKSTNGNDRGVQDPQLRALLQMLGLKLKNHLKDTAEHRELVTGVGSLRPVAEYPQIDGLQGNVLAVRSGYLPSTGDAAGLIAGGALFFVLNVLLWFYDKKRKARLEEAEEEQEPPPSLI
jgi:hypothetical protein